MGVTGLWPILAPSARPTPLPTLNRKRLAVDASIWIYQFLKAVRDKEGNALRNSHVVGFFRRICKLLFFGIKPVFVFDGGAPALKRQTILGRKKRREGRREDAVKTAGRLLAVQMQRRGEEEAARKKRDKGRVDMGLAAVEQDDDVITEDQEIVYVSEMGMSVQERTQNRKFKKTDAYHLPELTNGIEGMGKPDDPRIMSVEELEEYARQFNNGEDVNLYDFSKIDFNGEFFMSLPAGDRYNILNAARLRSRLRMGLSKEQLEEMFPDRMAFSRFQIDRVRERNELTQRLMNLNGMNEDLVGVGGGRIAGERGREYVLVKNDGVEGGWALGVVSTDKGIGERNKPIDVDALTKPVKQDEDSEEEEEFEDVPVEGLNRLPTTKSKAGKSNMTYEEFKASEMASQRKQFYASRNKAVPKVARHSDQRKDPSPEPDTLFVDEDQTNTAHRIDEEDEDLERAIALSLQKDVVSENDTHLGISGPSTQPEDHNISDEDEHLNRAIALSMQANHRKDIDSDDEADFEDVPVPQYNQQAVPAPKPIVKSSGSMIAHIVNNRANAAIKKPQPKPAAVDSDSDSDMDFQSALAKARKQKAPVQQRRQPAPVAPNTKNPFDGPLPFERLGFGGSIFSKGKTTNDLEKSLEDDEEAEEEELPGGFDKDLKDDAPKPIPPWLMREEDIRDQFEKQKQRDIELNAEDREMAEEEERQYRKDHAPIEIDSSDDGSDVEIVDPPTALETLSGKLGEVAEVVRAVPPKSSIPDNPDPNEPAAGLFNQNSAISGGNKNDPFTHTNELVGSDINPVTLNAVAAQTMETIADDDEEIEWSESDHGDVMTKRRSRPASEEFEDVPIPYSHTISNQIHSQSIPVREASPMFEDVVMTDFDPESSKPRHPLQSEESYQQQLAEEDAAFGDFSDPEEEELLAQLTIEAEEHARFASTLNNKSEKENQDAYERELKALRTQQKKDRRDADEVSHIMVTECQALLRLFGIPYITAPMEAEAQCAELVRLGLVDGVVTDDCDIFLFGGTRVYKNMFNSNKFVECYLLSDIEKELSLTRNQLISIAHLLGSDYTEGLPGIGPVTALEIISEFPTGTGLQEFKDWWDEVQMHPGTPNTETNKFRKKFRRAQGTKLFLPPMFPSGAVTEAYLKPEVDATPEPFQWGVPDLPQLREFLMATIGWTQERTDEVLVPVIRDMNRREAEGTQANITRYFDGAVGTGVRGVVGGGGGGVGKNTAKGSKRMNEAVGKLKAKKGGRGMGGGLGMTFAEEAVEWTKRNEEREKVEAKRAKGKEKGRGKGRKRGVAAVVEEEDEGEGGEKADVYNEDNAGGEEEEEEEEEQEQEGDDGSGSGHEVIETSSRIKAKGKTRSKDTGKSTSGAKRRRTKV